MLQFRENEIAPCQLSGGTAWLRTLEGTLPLVYMVVRNCMRTETNIYSM